MEVSGLVSRQLPGFFRREIVQAVEVSASDSRRVPCSLSVSGTRNVGTVRRRNFSAGFTAGNVNSRFYDDGHLQYYVGPRCHGKLKEEKEKVKRKLKLLKGLYGDLSASSQSGFVFHLDDGSVRELHGERMRISVEETREALERQLQQLKAEEKEQKRKRKLEKAKLKAARMQAIHDSSSSESSDNEGNVINMSYQIRKALLQPFPDERQMNAVQESTLPPLQTQQHGSNAENGSSVKRLGSGGRVEVCMGNKCKKAGAAALMEEFERVVGVEGAVCGCKCMGKCRDGPNVRVSGSMDTGAHSANPLCIGVGVEDVDRIVANFLGQGHKHSRFAPAT